MSLLAAAATDQTGRTITMLSAGLVAVAVGLTILTVWYWRFTSPTRRALMVEPEPDHRPIDDRSPLLDESADAPISESDDAANASGGPVTAVEPQPLSVGESSIIGLDDDQWEVLTKAVMEKYLDS